MAEYKQPDGHYHPAVNAVFPALFFNSDRNQVPLLRVFLHGIPTPEVTTSIKG
jgi:hypothetical protein